MPRRLALTFEDAREDENHKAQKKCCVYKYIRVGQSLGERFRHSTGTACGGTTFEAGKRVSVHPEAEDVAAPVGKRKEREEGARQVGQKRLRLNTIKRSYSSQWQLKLKKKFLRFVDSQHLSFNVFRSESGKDLVKHFRDLPGPVKVLWPSYNEIADMETVVHTADDVAGDLTEVRAPFYVTGATIMSDDRKSRDARPIVNFLADGSHRVMMVRTMNKKGEQGRAPDVLAHWIKVFDDFPPRWVNAICTDSASAYVAATNMLLGPSRGQSFDGSCGFRAQCMSATKSCQTLACQARGRRISFCGGERWCASLRSTTPLRQTCSGGPSRGQSFDGSHGFRAQCMSATKCCQILACQARGRRTSFCGGERWCASLRSTTLLCISSRGERADGSHLSLRNTFRIRVRYDAALDGSEARCAHMLELAQGAAHLLCPSRRDQRYYEGVAAAHIDPVTEVHDGTQGETTIVETALAGTQGEAAGGEATSAGMQGEEVRGDAAEGEAVGGEATRVKAAGMQVEPERLHKTAVAALEDPRLVPDQPLHDGQRTKDALRETVGMPLPTVFIEGVVHMSPGLEDI
ncbi:hypothetical protein CBR_g54921 [Chara braunii]|uniref:DUF659 domain-containing protein n=1 Tax=Chara braunii TaxID=69332 RepID=A0A388JPS1_CHABU|nr:hypothetical protein CBR_g54921 [Chara braunii]|eukprot:GBG59819.1 hypothetical protein CBR_g54921 [Chara braunii]